MRLRLRHRKLALTSVCALTLVAGASCAKAPVSNDAAAPATRTATTPATASGTTPAPAPQPPTTAPTSAPSADRCTATTLARLSPAEQAGQLIMVGLDVNAGDDSLDELVHKKHLGGVILLGGWYDGAEAVRETTGHLEGLAGASTGGLGLFLAADQEGGNVQQLRGEGFTRIPSALEQTDLGTRTLTAQATAWAKEIRSAGININLAPVTDTVPTSVGRANQPIGRWDRQYSSDPDTVARAAGAFIKGMRAGGVASTVKHFPGLGRITGNTDLTATDITDRVATVDDRYLRPFASGIADDAELVMVGSAIYSRIDPGVNAVFSERIVTGLLREKLGFDGVVITDDVGAAQAVAATPVGERATRFVDAGGDVVLTARPDTVRVMHDALLARMAAEPAFAAKVEDSVERVIRLKIDLGLARCD